MADLAQELRTYLTNHLQGKHSQASHGKGGGSSASPKKVRFKKTPDGGFVSSGGRFHLKKDDRTGFVLEDKMEGASIPIRSVVMGKNVAKSRAARGGDSLE